MTDTPRVLRVRWPANVAGPAGSIDCVIRDPGELTVGEFATLGASADLWPAPRPPFVAICARTGLRAEPDEPLAALEPREGDVITIEPANRTAPLGGLAGAAPAATPTRRILQVTGGPAAGTSLTMTGEPVTVGRDAGCELTLEDPSLSSQHLELRRGADGWSVRDLGSSNGTLLDGAPLAPNAAVLLDGEDVQITAGRSVLELRSYGKPTPVTLTAIGRGRLAVQRPERAAPASFNVTVDAPDTPRRGGPLRRDRGRLREQTSALAGQIDELVAREQRERHLRQPGAAELVRRAREADARLWERRPGHVDHLSVRFGLADQQAGVRVRHPRQADVELQAAQRAALPERRQLHGVPLARSLDEARVIGIAGRAATRDALARWVMLQLATLQSPRDVQLAAFSSEAAAQQWTWLKWLPHVRGGALTEAAVTPIATTDAERSALLTSVEARVHAAAEAAEAGSELPGAHLVCVVDAGALAADQAEALLRELRGDGRGATIIWLADELEALPQQCRLVIELDPQRAAATVRDTRSGGRWEDVTVDGIELALAEQVAMALASLRDEQEPSPAPAGGPVRVAYGGGETARATITSFSAASLAGLSD